MDEEVKAKIQAHGLPLTAWQEMFAEYDPEMFSAYVDWWTRARQHKELEPKVREFIAVAIDAVVDYPGITSHVNFALDAGATVQELVDVVIATGRLMGPHAFNRGLTAIEKVVHEREADGRPVQHRREDLPPQMSTSEQSSKAPK